MCRCRMQANFGLLIVCTALSVSCGAPPTEENREDRGETSVPGVLCDRFELRWELDGTDLLLTIDTDLPDEGELSVSVGRAYFEVGSD